ncbi:RHS repeat protein [Pedobacter sp. Hv1]|uniref:RHS repeat protein n=1 Tax=Pedobacter sp. Hv1 TaxID=1740090 RepID=UPI0006D8CEAF|nr:RHS repeat protein [Pedobacter sp. Hv1]KQC00150.1 hypothetical protein AQF98_11635 [Pedobacter sp. Hv1]
MKKLILAMLTISIVLNACKKEAIEEVVKIEPTHKNLLLKRVDNDGLVFNYTYDANNRLTSYTRTSNAANPAQSFTFIYNSNGSLAEMTNNNFNRTIFSYNADGTISKKLEYNGTGASATLINTYLYTYAAGVVTEQYIFASTGNGWRYLHTYDTKGNLIEIKYYTTTSSDLIGTFSGSSTYKYDDKPSYKSTMPKEFFFPNSAVNNLNVAYGNSGAVSYSYTYEYNVDGYPIKQSDGFNVSNFEYKRL